MMNVILCLTSSQTQCAMLIRIVITEEDGEWTDNYNACTRPSYRRDWVNYIRNPSAPLVTLGDIFILDIREARSILIQQKS